MDAFSSFSPPENVESNDTEWRLDVLDDAELRMPIDQGFYLAHESIPMSPTPTDPSSGPTLPPGLFLLSPSRSSLSSLARSPMRLSLRSSSRGTTTDTARHQDDNKAFDRSTEFSSDHVRGETITTQFADHFCVPNLPSNPVVPVTEPFALPPAPPTAEPSSAFRALIDLASSGSNSQERCQGNQCSPYSPTQIPSATKHTTQASFTSLGASNGSKRRVRSYSYHPREPFSSHPKRNQSPATKLPSFQAHPDPDFPGLPNKAKKTGASVASQGRRKRKKSKADDSADNTEKGRRKTETIYAENSSGSVIHVRTQSIDSGVTLFPLPISMYKIALAQQNLDLRRGFNVQFERDALLDKTQDSPFVQAVVELAKTTTPNLKTGVAAVLIKFVSKALRCRDVKGFLSVTTNLVESLGKDIPFLHRVGFVCRSILSEFVNIRVRAWLLFFEELRLGERKNVSGDTLCSCSAHHNLAYNLGFVPSKRCKPRCGGSQRPKWEQLSADSASTSVLPVPSASPSNSLSSICAEGIEEAGNEEAMLCEGKGSDGFYAESQSLYDHLAATARRAHQDWDSLRRATSKSSSTPSSFTVALDSEGSSSGFTAFVEKGEKGLQQQTELLLGLYPSVKSDTALLNSVLSGNKFTRKTNKPLSLNARMGGQLLGFGGECDVGLVQLVRILKEELARMKPMYEESVRHLEAELRTRGLGMHTAFLKFI